MRLFQGIAPLPEHGNEFLQVLRREILARDDDRRRMGGDADRHEVHDGIVFDVRRQHRRRDMRTHRRRQQGIAVGRGGGGARAANGAAGAAVNMPLESWIIRSAFGTPPDPYLAAASALARSARAGCGSMMIHYTRPSGTMALVEEAKAIARAADDVGIRIAFALAVRDQNPIVYGDSEPVLSNLSAEDRKTVEELFVKPAMSPRDYLTDAIAAAIVGPKIDVQLGPAGPRADRGSAPMRLRHRGRRRRAGAR